VSNAGALVGSTFNGTAWGAPAIIGGSGAAAGAALAFNGPASQAVGAVRAATGDTLLSTIWSAGVWSSLAPINLDTTRGTPLVAASAGTANVVFWGDNYEYYYEAFDGTTWTGAPSPVIPAGTAQQPCGPSPGALSTFAGGASFLFVNGTCGGTQNALYSTDDSTSGWSSSTQVAPDPSYAANLPPALTAPTAGADLVTVYVQQGTQQIYYASRSSGVWSSAQKIMNGLTASPIALAPLSAGGAWMAYVGTDGMLYASTFTSGTWATPAAVFSPNVAVSAVAAAAGIGKASAELVYLDTSGVAFHTRLVGGAWTPAVPVSPGVTGLVQAAMASGL